MPPPLAVLLWLLLVYLLVLCTKFGLHYICVCTLMCIGVCVCLFPFSLSFCLVWNRPYGSVWSGPLRSGPACPCSVRIIRERCRTPPPTCTRKPCRPSPPAQRTHAILNRHRCEKATQTFG